MRKSTEREEADAQRLYDALARRSRRDFSEYDGERPAPPIPREQSFLVDELLGLVEDELGLDRGETLAEVIELGLVAWFRRLGQEDCERLGLPYLGAAPEAVKELRTALEKERARIAELEIEIDALASASDPDPAKIQQKLAANGGDAPGYVPMSSHAAMNKAQPNKRPQRSKKSHKPRKRSRRRR
jgi:hypothetical protein